MRLAQTWTNKFLAAAEMWQVQRPADKVLLAKWSKALDQRQWISCHWASVNKYMFMLADRSLRRPELTLVG